ncbi:MAG TPA: hypothetical protein VGJ92_08205, partial [Methanocella sp.]
MNRWFRPLLPLLLIGFIVAIAAQSAAASPAITSVVAGYENSFVIMNDGSLWGWGDNHDGQLGSLSSGGQTPTEQLYPARMPIGDVKAVAVGGSYTLALKNDGTVWAWGDNTWGQLGDGTTKDHLEPAQVHGLSHVKAIAAGYGQNVALLDNGTVWAWGRSSRGQTGIGISGTDDILNVTEPQKVDISNVVAIGCGVDFSVALKGDGTVWNWGEDWDYTINAVPVQVPIADVAAISVGREDVFAQKKDGTVWGWGLNWFHQLGNMTYDLSQATPVRVDGLKDVAQVSAGATFTLALKKDGTVWAWGENNFGSLGNGCYYGANVATLIRVPDLADVVAISAGDGHSLVLKSDGTVWAWGLNDKGQIGPRSDERNDLLTGNITVPSPRQIGIGTPVTTPVPSSSASTTPSPTLRPVVSVVPVPVSSGVKELWNRQYEGSIQYIAEGDAGEMYAFSGNDIHCLRPDGSPIWNLTIPAAWSICNIGSALVKPGGPSMGTTEAPWPVFDAADGYLYVYGIPAELADGGSYSGNYPLDHDVANMSWSLFAISPEGEITWTLQLSIVWSAPDDTVVHVAGDRVYLFHSDNETVVDRSGKVIYTIPHIGGPVAVDGQGNTYSVPAFRMNRKLPGLDYRVSGSVLEARGPDGKLLWSKDVGEHIVQQYVVREQRSKYGSLPVYHDGALYVPVSLGIVVLDTSGNEKWSRLIDDGNGSTYRLFSLMPLDSAGRVYLTYDNPFDIYSTRIYVISPDG